MVAEDVVVTRWADLQPSPWKNGGGLTREVASSPEDSTTGDFDWRVSIADVTSPGPFSSFPGVDRVITLLEGGSMVLETDTDEIVLAPRQPRSFRGETPVDCHLPLGPTRDLNLMTRRGRATGEVAIHEGQLRVDPGSTDRHLVIALDDGSTVTGASGKRWDLGRHDVLEAAGSVGAPLVIEGAVAVIRVGL